MKQVVSGAIILRFRGEYADFSNFFECSVRYRDILYGSSEAAFQAQKTLDMKEREKIAGMKPQKAKWYCGPNGPITLRSDWDLVKVGEMRKIVEAKFKQNPLLMQKLLSTGHKYLIEGNTWHDNDWGDCFCRDCIEKPGLNLLGEMLMDIREEIRVTSSPYASTLVKLPDGSAIVAYAKPCDTYPSIQVHHLCNALGMMPTNDSMMCYAEMDATKQVDGLRTVVFDGSREDPDAIIPFNHPTGKRKESAS